MRVLGIDPGFAVVGFGILEDGKHTPQLVSCGAIRTNASLRLPARLVQIDGDLTELVGKFHPDAVAVEELYFTNNATTGIGVAQARGVILAACEKAFLPIFEYSPSEVKLAVTGYGKADKHQVMDMTKRILNLSSVIRPDDAADAVAIALCHMRSFTSKLRSDAASMPGTGRYQVRNTSKR